jgi:polyisoprenoid-binding protein YceI
MLDRLHRGSEAKGMSVIATDCSHMRGRGLATHTDLESAALQIVWRRAQDDQLCIIETTGMTRQVPVGFYRLLLMAFFIIAPNQSMAQSVRFRVNPDSSLFAFTVAHMGMLDVDGSFQNVDGLIEISRETSAPVSATVTLDVASITTGNASRDENLRSDEFLDVEQFPLIQFASRSIVKSETEQNMFHIVGDLTIYGVTKPLEMSVPFNFADSSGQSTIVIDAAFSLFRKDFKLSFGRIMNAMVGDEIHVRVRIAADIET